MTDMLYAKDPWRPIRALAENIMAAPKPGTELNALQNATGEQGERTLLTRMIEHHQGASQARRPSSPTGRTKLSWTPPPASATTTAPRTRR